MCEPQQVYDVNGNEATFVSDEVDTGLTNDFGVKNIADTLKNMKLEEPEHLSEDVKPLVSEQTTDSGFTLYKKIRKMEELFLLRAYEIMKKKVNVRNVTVVPKIRKRPPKLPAFSPWPENEYETFSPCLPAPPLFGDIRPLLQYPLQIPPVVTPSSTMSYGMPGLHHHHQAVRLGSTMEYGHLSAPMSYRERVHLPAMRGTSSRHAYVWQGELPPRDYCHPVFSCKIFVGGVPWDISEGALLEAFIPFGSCRVEWPGNEARFARMNHSPRGKVTGYVYMIFEQERSVKALLRECSQEFGSAGEWYFRLRVKRGNTIETRQVQVIPWVVSDASYFDDPGAHLDSKKTVFVGALHGMITAQVLFAIMNELYGKVLFVGIDTDKYKYPIGSGRVTFAAHGSYFRAIDSAFLEIITSKFKKRVQIDPFLEESDCMNCLMKPGPLFCRERTCFRYYCAECWGRRHQPGSQYSKHQYLTRSSPRLLSDQGFVY